MVISPKLFIERRNEKKRELRMCPGRYDTRASAPFWAKPPQLNERINFWEAVEYLVGSPKCPRRAAAKPLVPFCAADKRH